jgi:hypothetical protein
MSGQENSIAENNKLEGESHYALWKFQIQTILERELWEFVQPDEDDTSSIVVVLLDPRTIDTIKRAETKALSVIKLSAKDQIVPYILNVKNPKACWDVLKRRFEISNNARRLAVCHKFSNLHMEEGSSIADFMCTIQDIVN